MPKSGLFSKARVSVRVRVRIRVSFSSCEMTTFGEPDGVQGCTMKFQCEENVRNFPHV